ncbi:MAG: carbon starvation protein A [Phycisphaerales bacterium]
MPVLLTVLAVGVLLLLAYRFYGGWLSARVFQLNPSTPTPATTEEDGADYVPTRRSIVFGHHFTSIAGTGPIVGPAIAVMWGWVPALLWVVVGSIFIGAVHDLGSLVVSLRNKGRTIGDIAGLLLGPRARFLFLFILIVALWIVLAIFGLVIASVLRQYPSAIAPVVLQTPLAVVIGVLVHRKGRSIVLPSVCALGVMYLSVVFGDVGVLHDFNVWAAAQPTWVWIAVLLGYSGVASVLPVWVLLQPRDYINALQLITALALLVCGLIATGILGGPTIPVETATGEVIDHTLRLQWVAPALDWSPPGAPPLLPVLFITVACGACSGFHCLVGSGTTSKQLERETDAKPVGYGSMLTEGFLATLVIAACAAGIGLGASWDARESNGLRLIESVLLDFGHRAAFDKPAEDKVGRMIWRPYKDAHIRIDEAARFVTWGDPYLMVSKEDLGLEYTPFVPSPRFSLAGPHAFDAQYASWQSSNSLGAKVGAFVQGSANMLARLGIPVEAAIALMAVLVASFAATTLDTSCRLQRYVIQELARTFLPKRKAWECHACGYDRRALAQDAPCPECNADPPAPDETRTTRRGPWWNPCRWIATPIGATSIAILSAFALAMGPFPGAYGWYPPGSIVSHIQRSMPQRLEVWLTEGGAGALTLWPLFGATNQLLAGFAFVVIVSWLLLKRAPVVFAIVPAIIMLYIPAYAMVWQAFIGNEANPSWLSEGRTTLVVIACAALAMEAWLVIEACVAWRSRRFERALRDNGGEPVA